MAPESPISARRAGGTPPLYPAVLGAAWGGVGAAVRALHCDGGPVRASGTFCVTRGTGRLGRCLAGALRLPCEAGACAVRLSVAPHRGGEAWTRVFDGRNIITFQRVGRDGRMVERFGRLEFRFRLAAVGGALEYQQVAAAVRIGRHRVPLPAWAAPHVWARECEGEEDGSVCVHVRVSIPWAGPLLEYAGTMRREPGA